MREALDSPLVPPPATLRDYMSASPSLEKVKSESHAGYGAYVVYRHLCRAVTCAVVQVSQGVRRPCRRERGRDALTR